MSEENSSKIEGVDATAEVKESTRPRRRLFRRRKKRRVNPGSSPGQVIAPAESPKPILHLVSYDGTNLVERQVLDLKELHDLDEDKIHWLNVDGLGDAGIVTELGTIFHLHPLALEDVVSYEQRSKIEEYPESLFVVMRMPVYQSGVCSTVDTEQLSMFLRENVLVTFQGIPGGDPFENVRERLRKGKGKIRQRKADYLAYALMDAVIDSYFPLLDERSDEIESTEILILDRPTPSSLNRIHTLKQELVTIRRAIWPLREIVNSMIRDTSERVCDETKLYLRDCYDHCSQLLELAETYRELCSDLMQIYLSNISNKMNEVMRFLTVISTIFIPLTFIVGVYGMNFNTEISPLNMPELNWRFGYVMVWVVNIAVAYFSIREFRKRGWL